MRRTAALVMLLGQACGGRPALAPIVASPHAPATMSTRVSAEPPRAEGAAPLPDGVLAQGSTRPHTETVRFDVDAIPVATWGPPSRKAGFNLTVKQEDQSYHLIVHTYLFAETILLGTNEFTAFTGGPFFSGTLPKCGASERGTRAARWMGFSPNRWTDDGIDVEMGEGDFDVASCKTTATASLFARAKALVPGYVYALRVHDERDSLYVILPHAALVSAGGDPSAPLNASNTGTFARVRLPLAKDTAASAAVRISPTALGLWDQLRRTGLPVHDFADDRFMTSDSLLVTVEVSAQGDVKVASLSFALPRTAYAADYAPLLRAARSQAR